MTDTHSRLIASVKSRLDNLARENHIPFEDMLYRYTIERFLSRIATSEFREQFILKGGQVFLAWGLPIFRPTRDIDFRAYAYNSEETIQQIFISICSRTVSDDGIVFDAETVTCRHIIEDADYQGIRVTFTGHLGNSRIRMQIDLGFTDVIIPKPTSVVIKSLLDMPTIEIQAYPPEAVIAEKVHAIVFLGEINSRMKDYYDIWHISNSLNFDGERMLEAIQATFENRGMPIPSMVPAGLSEEFARTHQTMWKSGFLKKLANIGERPDDFASVIDQLQEFILPIFEAASTKTSFQKVWKPRFKWVNP